eukprot:scaffold6591_cov127-Skeletonema_marinoi.AAC.4
MAAELAREIIAQSKGGGKMAFKFSPSGTVNNDVVGDSLLLSALKDANQKAIYHVHLTKGDKAYEINYSNAEGACHLVTSIMREKVLYVKVDLVLYKKNTSECVSLSTVAPSIYVEKLSSSTQYNLNLNILDVIDVVEG